MTITTYQVKALHFEILTGTLKCNIIFRQQYIVVKAFWTWHLSRLLQIVYSEQVLIYPMFLFQSFIFDEQNLYIVSTIRLFGPCKLAFVVVCFIVPPIPSQGYLPWLVVKKTHSAFKPKSLKCKHKFRSFLEFLCGPPHPSEM